LPGGLKGGPAPPPRRGFDVTLRNHASKSVARTLPPICVAAGSAALIRCGTQIGSIWGGGNAGRIKGGAFMLGERMRQAAS